MSDRKPATTGHGSLRTYLTGFVLSVVLTVIPFAIVMGDMMSNHVWAIAVIFVMAGAQMVVHIHYFLQVSLRVDHGWQFMAMLLTILLLVIILSGSIWIMINLEDNMMPAHEQIERIRALQ